MLGRVAACAAVIFVWPICTHASDGDGPLLLSEIVIASDPEPAAQSQDAEADMQTAAAEVAALADTSALADTGERFARKPERLQRSHKAQSHPRSSPSDCM